MLLYNMQGGKDESHSPEGVWLTRAVMSSSSSDNTQITWALLFPGAWFTSNVISLFQPHWLTPCSLLDSPEVHGLDIWNWLYPTGYPHIQITTRQASFSSVRLLIKCIVFTMPFPILCLPYTQVFSIPCSLSSFLSVSVFFQIYFSCFLLLHLCCYYCLQVSHMEMVYMPQFHDFPYEWCWYMVTKSRVVFNEDMNACSYPQI